jgi:nitrogen fixation protein NifQ
MNSRVPLGYFELMQSSRFPGDLRTLAFAGVIAQALAARRRPLIRGLSESSFGRLMRTCFPGMELRNGSLAASDEHGIDEFEDLRSLLMDFCAAPGEIQDWLSCGVASAAMQEQHLWQDMGLPNRALLSRLLGDNFPALAARNVDDMKWKKFFYRQLCQRAGLVVCKSPNCNDCIDYLACFGPENSVVASLLPVAHRT